MRLIVSLAWTLLSLVVASIATTTLNGYFGTLVLFVMVSGFFIHSLEYEIPTEPVLMYGILKIFGKVTGTIMAEGKKFMPGHPYACDAILVSQEKEVLDFPIRGMMTPDEASNDIDSVRVEYVFDPENPRAYIKSGGPRYKFNPEKGCYEKIGGDKLNAALEKSITQRMRGWMHANEEGPQTWQEAEGAGSEAIQIILESAVGNALESIREDIPTPVLFKYFAGKTPNPAEIRTWGENWEKINVLLSSPDEKERVKKLIEKRRGLIQQLMEGSALLPKTDRGIKIIGFELGKIHPSGKTAAIAEEVAVAKVQQEAARVRRQTQREEFTHFAEIIQDTAKTANLEPAGAREFVELQLKTGVTKKIEQKTVAISPEMVAAGERLLKLVINRVFNNSKKAKGKGA